MTPKPAIVVCLCVALLAGGWFVWRLLEADRQLVEAAIGDAQVREIEQQQRELAAGSGGKRRDLGDEEIDRIVSEELRNQVADALIERLVQLMLANQLSAIKNEAVLAFPDEDGMETLLKRIESTSSGVELVATLDVLQAIRLRFEDMEDLRDLLAGITEDEGISIDANYAVRIPNYPIPDPDAPLAGASGGAPFRNNALRFLGVDPGENANWGEGVTVAVIDSGVAEHPTFREGQVRHVGEIKEVPEAEPGANPIPDGHGTAVASIIAGSDSRTPGVAPAAGILSFQLLDDEGSGDSFTLAQMMTDAVDLGADLINLSLGSYGDSLLVREAVAYASEHQRLVIASTGNDATDSIAFPAAYEDSIAVGAIDAQGEHLEFSNSGEQLDLAAPGLAVDAAWPNNQMVGFSGTSASAPFVTGAIAAVMSEIPGMRPVQAWELLRQFTDEAGAPGMDPLFGSGNLNLGRLMERDQRGIHDVAVVSHHFAPESEFVQNVQVTVQNRGTELVQNLSLEVNSSNRVLGFVIPMLQPGQIATREVPVDLRRADADGHVSIQSEARLSRQVQDRIPANNLRQSIIEFPESETAVNP